MATYRQKENTTAPLWRFLEFLKTEGYELSTGQYLNIYRLLQRIDFNTTAFGDLKYIIGPLLSKTPEEQEKFYAVFDTYFGAVEKKANIDKQKPKNKVINNIDKRKKKIRSNKRKKFIVVLVLSVVVLIGLGIGYIYLIKPILSDPEISEKKVVNQKKEEINKIFADLLNSPELNTEKFSEAKKTIEKAEKEFKTGKIKESYDTLDNLIYYSRLDFENHQSLRQKISELRSRINPFIYKRPNLINIEKPDVEIYLSLILILIFFLNEYQKSQNQSFIAELEQGKKPPYVWQFNLNHKPKIIWDNEIYQTAHHLRKRVIGDELDFDINRTIKETLNHGGLLELTYKPRSKPSEYIALIDKSYLQSHQASFFSFLANEFSESDIHIDQFFYQDNMLMFWSESQNKKHYSLEDLIKLFPKHRVLIFGMGHEMLDITKGAIKKYALGMNNWSDVAILTPRPTSDWDYREKILSQSFIILPASSSGLIELIDTFEKIKSTQLGAWKFEHASTGIELPDDVNLGIKHLSYQLTPDVFKWLCICAVYPQLFWDLTLYLGDVMFPGKSIITQQNLLSLLKTPWFNNGFIPLEYREQLTAQLDDATKDEVRKKIVEQMRKNPPKKNTHAFDEYKLNLLVNELLIRDISNEKKKIIRREIKDMESHTDFGHYTEIKAIQPNKSTSALDFILPEELQNIFKGVGWKKTFARAFLFLSLSFIGVYFLSDYIYRAIEDDKQLETIGITISTILYGFAFYRFMRKRSLLNSFEVAFYWLFLSIGYMYAFILTNTSFFTIVNNTKNKEDNSFFNFFIITLILTILLIKNQVKKGIIGAAVAMYWFFFSLLLILIFLISLPNIINGFNEDESLVLAFITIIIGSILYWIIRFKRIKSFSKTEIGIYFSMSYVVLMIYSLNEWKEGFILCNLFFVIFLIIVARKWNIRQFIGDSSFSVFWIGIFAALLIMSDEYKIDALVFITLAITCGIILNKWLKHKSLSYESSIYSLMIILSAMLGLDKFDLPEEETMVVGLCLSVLLLFLSFKIRKYNLHTIELFVYWVGLTILSVAVYGEFDINPTILVMLMTLIGVLFIIYKIKSHKKLREAYSLNM
ncbi:hypothetical protein [Hwangdonia sp.]|uniref:hypothetical protein n=1 Tax=Hwangdonia sp. TaxID=1883432 RepID=UPI003AB24884